MNELSLLEPLRVHQFKVFLNGEDKPVPVTSVTGLRYISDADTRGLYATVTLTRAVLSGGDNRFLRLASERSVVPMRIVVGGVLTFHIGSAVPSYLGYTDLDAGGAGEKSMLECLEFQVDSIIPEYGVSE